MSFLLTRVHVHVCINQNKKKTRRKHLVDNVSNGTVVAFNSKIISKCL